MSGKSKVWKVLSDLSSEDGVTEIVFNSSKNIFVEKNSKFYPVNTNLGQNDIQVFCTEVAQLNSKLFDSKNPIFNGRLPDGSRINIISSDHTDGHHAITIRRHHNVIIDLEKNSNQYELGENWVQFFKTCVLANQNIIVYGKTGVGKTTFMNAVIKFIPTQERVITIEDTRELRLAHPNWVALESNNSIEFSDLVKNALRMRPDRIIVGECRGIEVFELFQAMSTGHDGSLCSIHADSFKDVIHRLESLYLLKQDIPLKAIRRHISQAIDLIVHLDRTKDGRRIVRSIHEVTGIEGDSILSTKIAQNDDKGLKTTGIPSQKIDKLSKFGLPMDFFNKN